MNPVFRKIQIRAAQIRKTSILTRAKNLRRSFVLGSALTLTTLTLTMGLQARAESSFQDGEAAVEFDGSAAPATPSILPNKVRSIDDPAATPMSAPSRKGSQPHVGRKAAEKYMGQKPGHTSDAEPENHSRESRRREDSHD